MQAAQEYLAKVKNHQMTAILVEKDEKQRESLDAELKRVQPYGQGLGGIITSRTSSWKSSF